MLRLITNLPRLPARLRDGHKGTFGTTLVVAGSVGMSGAAILAGSGALRSGTGLVQVATPVSVQPVVAAANPCYLTLPLPVDAEGNLTAGALEIILACKASAVAFGPGLGRTQVISGLLEGLLERYEGPLVVDADGLYALGQIMQKSGPLQPRRVSMVCTPHPGEFSLLTGLTTQHIQSERKPLAVRFATEQHVILVLKGHGTVVTDGQRVFVNNTGNTGLAKGGSGDVLTGVIAGLMAQGMPPFEAAQLGVHLHGLAGDLATAAIGEHGILPTDVVEALPAVFKRYAAG